MKKYLNLILSIFILLGGCVKQNSNKIETNIIPGKYECYEYKSENNDYSYSIVNIYDDLSYDMETFNLSHTGELTQYDNENAVGELVQLSDNVFKLSMTPEKLAVYNIQLIRFKENELYKFPLQRLLINIGEEWGCGLDVTCTDEQIPSTDILESYKFDIEKNSCKLIK